jgi:hypothetical protein
LTQEGRPPSPPATTDTSTHATAMAAARSSAAAPEVSSSSRLDCADYRRRQRGARANARKSAAAWQDHEPSLGLWSDRSEIRRP